MLADGGRPHLLRCALSRSGEQVPMLRPAASSHIYTRHLMHRSAENSKAALFSPIQLCGSATEHTNTHGLKNEAVCPLKDTIVLMAAQSGRGLFAELGV